MDKKPEQGRIFSDKLSEHWAAALGIGTVAAAGVAGAALIHQQRQEQANPEKKYSEQLAVLNDPDELPRPLRQDAQNVLRDLNNLAAQLLYDGLLTWKDWHAKSGLSERRFETLRRVLEKRGVVHQPPEMAAYTHPPYAPQTSLNHAAEHLEGYPMLEEAYNALQNAHARNQNAS